MRENRINAFDHPPHVKRARRNGGL
jgi:hypothetical protein